MYVFKRKSVFSEVQFVMFSSRALATRIGGGSFSSITSAIYWIFGFSPKQNWAVLTDERFCALMKHLVLPAIQTELKLAKCFYFAVGIDSRAKPGKRVARVGKLWSSETLLYQNVSIWFFYYVMQKLSIFNIYKIWTGVMWSTLKNKQRSTTRSW